MVLKALIIGNIRINTFRFFEIDVAILTRHSEKKRQTVTVVRLRCFTGWPTP